MSAEVLNLCTSICDQKTIAATISIQSAFRGARSRRITDQFNTTAFQCLSISICDLSVPTSSSAVHFNPFVICNIFPGETRSELVSTDQISNSSSSTHILGTTRYFWNEGDDVLVTGANVFGRIVLNVMNTSSFLFGTDTVIGQAVIDLRDHKGIFVNTETRTTTITLPVCAPIFPVHSVAGTLIEQKETHSPNFSLTIRLTAQAAAYTTSDWLDKVDVNIFGVESTSKVWVVVFNSEIRVYEKSFCLKNASKSQCQVISCNEVKKIIIQFSEDRFSFTLWLDMHGSSSSKFVSYERQTFGIWESILRRCCTRATVVDNKDSSNTPIL